MFDLKLLEQFSDTIKTATSMKQVHAAIESQSINPRRLVLNLRMLAAIDEKRVDADTYPTAVAMLEREKIEAIFEKLDTLFPESARGKSKIRCLYDRIITKNNLKKDWYHLSLVRQEKVTTDNSVECFYDEEGEQEPRLYGFPKYGADVYLTKKRVDGRTEYYLRYSTDDDSLSFSEKLTLGETDTDGYLNFYDVAQEEWVQFKVTRDEDGRSVLRKRDYYFSENAETGKLSAYIRHNNITHSERFSASRKHPARSSLKTEHNLAKAFAKQELFTFLTQHAYRKNYNTSDMERNIEHDFRRFIAKRSYNFSFLKAGLYEKMLTRGLRKLVSESDDFPAAIKELYDNSGMHAVLNKQFNATTDLTHTVVEWDSKEEDGTSKNTVKYNLPLFEKFEPAGTDAASTIVITNLLLQIHDNNTYRIFNVKVGDNDDQKLFQRPAMNEAGNFVWQTFTLEDGNLTPLKDGHKFNLDNIDTVIQAKLDTILSAEDGYNSSQREQAKFLKNPRDAFYYSNILKLQKNQEYLGFIKQLDQLVTMRDIIRRQPANGFPGSPQWFADAISRQQLVAKLTQRIAAIRVKANGANGANVAMAKSSVSRAQPLIVAQTDDAIDAMKSVHNRHCNANGDNPLSIARSSDNTPSVITSHMRKPSRGEHSPSVVFTAETNQIAIQHCDDNHDDFVKTAKHAIRMMFKVKLGTESPSPSQRYRLVLTPTGTPHARHAMEAAIKAMGCRMPEHYNRQRVADETPARDSFESPTSATDKAMASISSAKTSSS